MKLKERGRDSQSLKVRAPSWKTLAVLLERRSREERGTQGDLVGLREMLAGLLREAMCPAAWRQS